MIGIYEKQTGSPDRMYYVYTDRLGSYHVITDETGSELERLSFDPWGLRRNSGDWGKEEAAGTNHLFSRGFTGHEHLDDYKTINMNGRLYDPVIATFFSPDPFVADATSTQDFNRYSYARNNPLMYTDPTGYKWWHWVAGAFLLDPISAITTATVTAGTASITLGATSSALYTSGSSILATAHATLSSLTYAKGFFTGLFDPAKGWDIINNAFQIDLGLFRTDKTQSFGYQAWQILARVTPFESVGYQVGNTVAHYYNLKGDVESVHNFYGATIINTKPGAVSEYAYTLSNYIYGNFDVTDIRYKENGELELKSSVLIHEYGHYLQGRAWGSIGSIFAALNSSGHNRETDSEAWCERDASLRGMNYFSDKKRGFSMSGYGTLHWGEHIFRQNVNLGWIRTLLFF